MFGYNSLTVSYFSNVVPEPLVKSTRTQKWVPSWSSLIKSSIMLAVGAFVSMAIRDTGIISERASSVYAMPDTARHLSIVVQQIAKDVRDIKANQSELNTTIKVQTQRIDDLILFRQTPTHTTSYVANESTH
jgi:hypothetical protein